MRGTVCGAWSVAFLAPCLPACLCPPSTCRLPACALPPGLHSGARLKMLASRAADVAAVQVAHDDALVPGFDAELP